MTEHVREVGFFAELRHGRPDGPSLRAAVRPTGDPSEDQLVSYLRSGPTLATTGQMASDVLAGDDVPVAPLAVLTDGAWIWPADLAYYVERYHVRLPEEFVQHAAARGWTPPALTHEELVAVELQVFPD